MNGYRRGSAKICVWQSHAFAGISKLTGVAGWDALARASLRAISPARTAAPRAFRRVIGPRGIRILLPADGRQESPIGAAILLGDFESALLAQQPAEGLGSVGVLKIQADALAALQLDLPPGDDRREVASRAAISRDQVQPYLPVGMFQMQ